MKDQGRKTDMWQLVVKDPMLLSGASVAGTLRTLAALTKADIAVIDEVEGGGNGRLQLMSAKLIICTIREALEMVERMTQFDWGDFYMFRNRGAARALAPNTSYVPPPPGIGGMSGDSGGWSPPKESVASRVAKSLVTLRCVDNTYFYIYGSSPSLCDALRSALDISEEKVGEMDDLDYPY